jgi:hypothetical protein
LKGKGEDEASSDIGPLKRPPFTYKILKIKLVKVLVLMISISKPYNDDDWGMSSTRKMALRVENAVRRPSTFQPRRRPTGTGEDEGQPEMLSSMS